MTKDHKNTLFKIIQEVVSSQHFAVVATEASSQPYTSLVSFVASEDLCHLYFPTKKETQKFINITTNNRVAVLLDNRKNMPMDIANAITIIALGTAREAIPEQNELERLLLQKHPALSEFLSHPSCRIIDVAVHTYQLVQNFERVEILPLIKSKR
jgi:nitroimidazol reductase NimA-like FMN-containing flavoprotein (pyridoxamine 5'-phosphate oxidase superfamily)